MESQKDKKVNGWYDVTLTPAPDSSVRILFSDRLNIFVGFHEGEKFTQVLYGEHGLKSNIYKYHTNITHWMPLPPFPDPEYYNKALMELREDVERIFFPSHFK